MKLNSDGINLIKSRESCRLEAYRCPAGVWTIGYGHTGPEVHRDLKVTQAEAEALLQSDLIVVDAAVVRTCPVTTDCQHAAMVSLAYNIGPGNFARSAVARLHNGRKYAQAAQAFALWNKANGRVLAGLVARRAEEAALYLRDTAYENVPNGDGERSLLASRTLNGQAIAGAGVAASAGLPVLAGVGDAWPEWQSDILQLVPYFDHLKWLLLLLMIVGIGLTLYARLRDRNEGRA
jgi:lysozyme